VCKNTSTVAGRYTLSQVATAITLSKPSSRAKGRHERIGRRIPQLRSDYGRKRNKNVLRCFHEILRFARAFAHASLWMTFFIVESEIFFHSCDERVSRQRRKYFRASSVITPLRIWRLRNAPYILQTYHQYDCSCRCTRKPDYPIQPEIEMDSKGLTTTAAPFPRTPDKSGSGKINGRAVGHFHF